MSCKYENILFLLWMVLHMTYTNAELPGTCEDIYHTVSTSTGVYSLTSGSHTFKAFCQFNDDSTGYFFPSLEAVQFNDTFELNIQEQLSDKSEIMIRILQDDGSQLDAKQEQINMYSERNLTVTLNFGEFHRCTLCSTYPHLLVNFVHTSIISAGVTNGWKSNGQEMSFVNCDNNPNSYIAFGSISGDTSGLGHTSDNGIMNIWRQTPVTTNNENMIPSSETNNFGFILEFHFGGCGAFQTSINWPTYNANPISATSAAVGFKFRIHNSCDSVSPCGNHGDCVDTVHSYYCVCHDGYFGLACDYDVTYIGCYIDNQPRSINGYSTQDGFTSITSCAEDCIVRGYDYFGVQNTRECYCGEEYNQYGRAASDDDCNQKCVGNTQQICGASLKNSVYKVRKLAPCDVPNCVSCDESNLHYCLVCEADMLAVNGICQDILYVGCFVDEPTRAMQGFHTLGMAFPSPQYCIDICARQLYNYAGTEIGTQCFCDNEYRKYGRAENEGSCHYTYPNSPSLSGGGGWHLAVYSLYPKANTKRYLKNEDVTWITPQALISFPSTVGVIDCIARAFSIDEAKSVSYDAEINICHVYNSTDGMFLNNVKRVF